MRYTPNSLQLDAGRGILVKARRRTRPFRRPECEVRTTPETNPDARAHAESSSPGIAQAEPGVAGAQRSGA
jgi:hypothetical protein